MNQGTLIVDIAGIELTSREIERLTDPRVGGVILFTRNYETPDQLNALTQSIHALRPLAPLLITVDHEGGRVQRFREGFTRLSAMRELGALHDLDPKKAGDTAQSLGYTLASELKNHGVDFAFTPVLDLDYGPSRVIGDRAFHRNPEVVSSLAMALGRGLREGGMGTCGKHFPGHGYVIPDSHHELPVDERSLSAIQEDLIPYQALIRAGLLDSVMAAHVIYREFDDKTAVFSKRWIDYLRNNLAFNGVVFTDDLSMAGAAVVGDMVARVQAADGAGCDFLLVCNAPDAADEVLMRWMPKPDPLRDQRIESFRERLQVANRTGMR